MAVADSTDSTHSDHSDHTTESMVTPQLAIQPSVDHEPHATRPTVGDRRPDAVVVMGVSGSGKTTVAEGIARALGWEFADADDFHSPTNVAKMNRGEPLTDDDRWPWLEAVGGWIAERLAAGKSVVVACSALRRK